MTISIKNLRNHPSLITWCAGNEFSPEKPGNKDLAEIAERLVAEFDCTRLFWLSSPNPPISSPLYPFSLPLDPFSLPIDPRGDRHPYIYGSGYDFTWHKKFEDIEMASEFGIPLFCSRHKESSESSCLKKNLKKFPLKSFTKNRIALLSIIGRKSI